MSTFVTAAGSTFTTFTRQTEQPFPFDTELHIAAIRRAGKLTGEFGHTEACRLALRALEVATRQFPDIPPTEEQLENVIEQTLLLSPWKKSTAAYLNARDRRLREYYRHLGSGLHPVKSRRGKAGHGSVKSEAPLFSRTEEHIAAL